MPFATAKSTNLAPRYSLPELALPAVLPTDAASLTALPHSVIALFSDTVAGASASAVIYSVLETAKANGVEPYTWLRRVPSDLPVAKTVDDVDALLPWNLPRATTNGEHNAQTGLLQ